MLTDKPYEPKLHCIRGGRDDVNTQWVSRAEYDELKRNCELWYKMWLHERMRKE